MAVEKVPSWIKQVLMPELNEMKGELKAIHTRIDSVETQIGSLRNETKSEISRIEEKIDTRITSLDERITSLRNETKSEFTGLNYRFDSLEKRLALA